MPKGEQKGPEGRRARISLGTTQSIQVGVTELPQGQQWEFLAVIIIEQWLEGSPAAEATARVVSRTLGNESLPRMEQWITPTQTNVTPKVLQQGCRLCLGSGNYSPHGTHRVQDGLKGNS